MPDVSGDGLPNDLLGNAGMRGDDQAIQITGYAGKVRITFYVFDFGSVRVDGKQFVAGLAQFAEHGVRGAISPARNASDGDSLSAQKVRNERGQWPHRNVLGQIQPHGTLRGKHTGRRVISDQRPAIRRQERFLASLGMTNGRRTARLRRTGPTQANATQEQPGGRGHDVSCPYGQEKTQEPV